MNSALRRLLDQGDGVVTWDEVREGLPLWSLDRVCRSGELHRLLPGVYVDADMREPSPEALRRAAVAWAGGRGALSHTTALDVWGLRSQHSGEPVHLSVPFGLRQRQMDLRRDALLATVASGVVRFAHRRLVRGPEQVRREILAIPPAVTDG